VFRELMTSRILAAAAVFCRTMANLEKTYIYSQLQKAKIGVNVIGYWGTAGVT